ncbi:hypothetical protein Thimo_3264 [Thioflavicoccus mobilis 8321]|uniref:Uncharacterized protein n=1 Tax=Thioflavicoccus mobilis 8321 TaxID=765912 RepID=L0H1L7_9GAMM|nr:hypothetical protein [Thioflavicoccus mobilis]AGA91942.1 hypothetical protein Thimo_3264 [Thioflavicoccus mobilis 8321]
MSIPRKHYRRKLDLFSLLVAFVVVGMALTLAYQINLFYGGQMIPIAKQAPAPGSDKVVDG